MASAHSQSIPDFRVNELASLNGSSQGDPRLAGDGQGTTVVTWQDKRNGNDEDIFAQIYSADGTAMGPNFRVSREVERASQYRPAVAVNAAGDFVIAWQDKRRGDWEIYVQRFAGDGTARGDHIVVNEDPEGTEQVLPSVTMDSSGNFTVVWADDRSGDYDIYAQRLAADGTMIGGNVLINDDDEGVSQYWPICAGNGAGDLIVTWTDERDGDHFNHDVYAQHYLSDGTAVGGNFRVNADAGGFNQAWSTAEMAENGDFIIAWPDERMGQYDVFAQRYAASGQALGDNFRVHEDGGDVFHSSPSVSTDPAGNFVVSWTDGRADSCDIYARRFTAAGVPVGDSFMVNEGGDDLYHVDSGIFVNDDGTFSVVWNDYGVGFPGEIFARSFTSDDLPVMDMVRVNDDLGSENQIEPAIAMDSDENTIIAWVDHRGGSNEIYAKRLSSDGSALGPDFKVSDIEGHYDQWDPSVAIDPDGYFVIVWSDYREEGCCSSDIYAQRYAPDGTTLGGNFKVNFMGAEVHIGPAVAFNGAGSFLVTWSDHAEDSKDDESRGSEPDIYAQHISRNGIPTENNFKVNDDVGFTRQSSPAITVDADNNYIIAWEDERDGEADIFWQRVSADGLLLGSNVRVEGDAPGIEKRGAAISADGQGGFVIAWKDGQYGEYSVYAQCFAADGSPVGDNVRASNGTGILTRYAPSLSMNDAGNFVVMWEEWLAQDRDIFAQQFLVGGLPMGENYRVSDTSDREQRGPGVVLGTHRIYAAWQDNRGGQSGHDIWANVLDWDTALAVDESSPSLPALSFHLFQNAPNPFNPATTIKYRTSESEPVTLEVFDVRGRKISTLVNEVKESGTYEVSFEASKLGSGVYFYRLQAGDSVSTRRMVLVK